MTASLSRSSLSALVAGAPARGECPLLEQGADGGVGLFVGSLRGNEGFGEQCLVNRW